MSQHDHEHYVREALALAKEAQENGKRPMTIIGPMLEEESAAIHQPTILAKS